MVLFDVCHCGCHGRIIFNDGTRSLPARNKMEALQFMDEAFREGKISEHEILDLMTEICESDLPGDIDSISVVVVQLADPEMN